MSQCEKLINFQTRFPFKIMADLAGSKQRYGENVSNPKTSRKRRSILHIWFKNQYKKKKMEYGWKRSQVFTRTLYFNEPGGRYPQFFITQIWSTTYALGVCCEGPLRATDFLHTSSKYRDLVSPVPDVSEGRRNVAQTKSALCSVWKTVGQKLVNRRGKRVRGGVPWLMQSYADCYSIEEYKLRIENQSSRTQKEHQRNRKT